MKQERASKREMLTILSERIIPFTKNDLRGYPKSVRRSLADSARQNDVRTKGKTKIIVETE